MKLHAKVLDILFRLLSPERLIRRILDNPAPIDREYISALFMEHSEEVFHGYSYNEQLNIIASFLDSNRDSGISLPPFQQLLDYDNKLFVFNSGGPACKHENVMIWRDAYLMLGQDLFVTSWLSGRKSGYDPSSGFSWPIILPTDDRSLTRIVEGASENHLHLYAGASTFSLSWCALMNHPEIILRADWLEELLLAHTIRGPEENLWSMKRKMVYAIFLRARLFEQIHGYNDTNLLAQLRSFDAGYSFDEFACLELKKEIDILRFAYGAKIPQPDSVEARCLDYSLMSSMQADLDSDYRLLAGERYLLYTCFEKSFHGGFSATEQWIFYLYLLLKSQLRNELVQINHRVGFHNFSCYDGRKKNLWRSYSEYYQEDFRQAVNAPLRNEKLSSLEGRVCPENSPYENIRALHEIDRAKMFFDCRDYDSQTLVRSWASSYHMPNLADNQSFYYLFHFPKEADRFPHGEIKSGLVCRHQKQRQLYRQQAIALAKALSNSTYFCDRVHGIDACSHEIGCRPEVFATVFRFLRGFNPKYYRTNVCAACQPLLGITYHAGEDFLDITDGLRAIDEAVCFLGMQRNDRIGHALALGVRPSIHYRLKFQTSVLPRQDLLDNCIWLLHRSGELGVSIGGKLQSRLQVEAVEQLQYIYGASFEKLPSLTEYYFSMLLRGDEPAHYQSGKFDSIPTLDSFEFFSLNPARTYHPLAEYRENKIVSSLVFCYHYDHTAKRRGAEIAQFEVDSDYESLIWNMQEALQRDLCDKGIRIECNPSSNVLIGTFGDYKNHPIFRLNDYTLSAEPSGVQLHVSVNSDDPGVFDTSLSFEYALLHRTLQDMTDSSGARLFSDAQIAQYMKNLVQMSQEQVFPSWR